ncbi:hypothetical protein GOP47_0015681 [Adiantum capillus-veneris]|uniref:Uncharacterized protein n=1 Tax=Adiantum capillus-veneris TaxID=13818 RepID=A0A9D4UK80_ADICA|nr:hypothetical protein GOP47_0015681 [Adiantum capillus-veneris]
MFAQWPTTASTAPLILLHVASPSPVDRLANVTTGRPLHNAHSPLLPRHNFAKAACRPLPSALFRRCRLWRHRLRREKLRHQLKNNSSSSQEKQFASIEEVLHRKQTAVGEDKTPGSRCLSYVVACSASKIILQFSLVKGTFRKSTIACLFPVRNSTTAQSSTSLKLKVIKKIEDRSHGESRISRQINRAIIKLLKFFSFQ